jgi:two-component system chemotaxis response regulator CheB
MSNGNLLIIGSSTGGARILEELFSQLPRLNASIIIVQHITPIIDEAFVASLARTTAMPVSLAMEGEPLKSGHLYIAPGGIHLTVDNNHRIRLVDGEKVNSVRPSIDVAMKSLVRPTTGRLAGVILTGMGSDGAAGIAYVKQLGGVTIAQDKNSSIIYGMPKAAVETGMIDFVLSTADIAKKLSELFKSSVTVKG